jgi:cell division protein FtsB
MDDDVRRLLGRARPQGRRAEEPPLQRDNRYVYGGDAARRTEPGPPRVNKKIVRRRISTFNTIVLLFGGGLLILLYVHNIITINHLAADVGQLQARYDSVQNANASLRAEVNRKSAWERIGKTATEQLGLVSAREQAQPITLDREALERAREQWRVNERGKENVKRGNDGGQARPSGR